MSKRRQSRPRRVEHYIVQPNAYNAVIQLMGTLPYVKVAGTLQGFTEGSRAVFEKLPTDQKPPAGKIVDNPPEPHDWRWHQSDQADGPGFLCHTCMKFHKADDHHELPPPGECSGPRHDELEVDPPANDDETPPVENHPKESA